MERRQSTSDFTRDQSCPLKMRADLAVVRQTGHGELRWLIKDPVSLRYFGLSEVEYAVLRMLDGTATLKHITNAIAKQFPPRIATLEQLQALLHRFHESGLAFGEGAAQAAASQQA